jgi:hypothetical protein
MKTPPRREHDHKRQPDLDLEGHDWSWTAESQDEMGRYFAEQDKMAKENEKKQNPNPPF